MRFRLAAILYFASAMLLGTPLFAQPVPPKKEFPVGAVRALQDVPAGRLRNQIARLPAGARDRAVAWLGNIHFTELDLQTLHVDTQGGIYFVDEVPPGAIDPVAESATVETSSAAVPVSPLPANLVFHSKPGAPNVIYLNFSGENVMNTAWNDSLGRSSIPAVAFSKDSDLTTFSDAEQLAIRRIWQRVAEDYALFDVDVTTERPGTFTTRTAHALITRNTDANDLENPAASSGGVAYVGVFANLTYAKYRPAWIYGNNLGGDESFIAEAVSHEIGHNLGLTHDGKTDGSDYYGGHGSGETSWGPLMGTGYNRNVSQWSKGDYYLANNTQDDLATIASKMAYRTDDHASTFGSATPLTISSSGIISATTPETDPASTSTVNKGRIERNTDADVFSFTTGPGTISILVEPWIVPSGYTRGGNIDLLVELHNASGQLLLSNNAPDRTGAIIQPSLPQGVYYLTVKNSAAGNPTSSTPSGYSSYGSVGQYFITGSVIANTIVLPPGAELAVTDITDPGVATKTFSVTYSDDVAVEVATIGNGDIRVTGPNGYNAPATFVSVDLNSNGTPRTATYSIPPPSSVWTENDGGTYTVSILTDAVGDTQGAFVPAGVLGTFQVAVPRTIYFADMNTNPGWSFGGLWQYGLPVYALGSGPLSGYTGLNIVGYNLAGNYENRLSAVYATTPTINSSGASSVTLQFRRWLRVRSNDTADIQISTNGTSWTDLWSNNGSAIADSAWQLVQYTLPAAFAGSPSLQLRWGMASGQTQNDIGWNIDDVALLGNGVLDTTAPTAELSVANITSSGSPAHSFAVTYSDDTGINVDSLGSSDLFVVGPNGTNLVEFGGVDTTSNGTPRTALYSMNAPNGLWQSSDNGEYSIYLQANEVSDTSGNSMNGALLGSFTVAISTVQQALVVDPQQLNVTEGSQVSFSVSLAAQPSADVVVVAGIATGGDSDIVIVAGATNIFTPQNWNIPAQVTLTAQADADQVNGSATVVCRSEGLAPVNVTVTEQDTTPTPPTVAITSPSHNAQFLSTDTIQFSADANDDGAVAKVEFFAGSTLLGTDTAAPYNISASLSPGTYSIHAKATDNGGATATSSVISITVAAPNQPPTVAITSPSHNAQFLSTDMIQFTADANDNGSVAKVGFFAGSTLLGTDTAAPYNISTSLSPGTYSIHAKATDNAGATATSSVISITVAAPNQPPTVAITSPSHNAQFVSTDTIQFSADANDDGAVAKVEFFAGSTLLGTDTAAPYNISASLSPGTYSIHAKATDNAGATATSSVISITVTAPNQPPTVAITSPSAGASFLSTDNITIAANATDDKTIALVEFFADGASIGSDNAAPYSVSTTLAAGTYSLTVRATDNDGASTLSSAVSITVVAPNQPPTVAITSPSEGGTFLSTDNITIAASATDDDAIASVQFFANEIAIGSDSTAPYSISVTLSAGSYSLSAKATDNDGVSTSSSAVLINVAAPNQPPTVAITSPSPGARFLSTDDISIAANAMDDHTIVAVEFFANDISIGSDNSAPYAVSTTLAAGTYSLTARATDNDGASIISSTVSITVAVPNQPPTIAISSPQAGATFSPTGSITIDVEAEDDGTIISVELFANDSKLADLDAAPYSFSASLAPGTHQLIAKATDDRGLMSTSAPVQITIEEATPPQIVAISFGSDTVTITSGTSSGVEHVLEASTDFLSWQAVATNTPVSGTLTFSIEATASKNFYRIVVPASANE